MTRRLALTPGQQHAVSRQAGVCGASVRRWLHGVNGLPAVDGEIRRALVALGIEVTRGDPLANVDAETRQLLMPVAEMPPAPATPAQAPESTELLSALASARTAAEALPMAVIPAGDTARAAAWQDQVDAALPPLDVQATATVGQEDWDQINALLVNPPKATPALRAVLDRTKPRDHCHIILTDHLDRLLDDEGQPVAGEAQP